MISEGDSPPGIVSHLSCRCGVRLGTGQVARPSPAPVLFGAAGCSDNGAPCYEECAHTYTHPPTHTRVLTHACTHTRPHAHALHVHMHTHRGTHTHPTHACTLTPHTCAAHTYTQIHMHRAGYTLRHTSAHAHVDTHARTPGLQHVISATESRCHEP